MNSIKLAMSITVFFYAALMGYCQGTFQDLDFESANLSPVPPGQGGGFQSIVLALPGWSASLGNNPVTQVTENLISTGSANIGIFGPDWSSVPGILDGNYSVELQAGFGAGFSEIDAALWQDGTIPADAKSLQFKAVSFEGGAPLSVSFAGDGLPLVVLSSGISPSGQSYNVYGANISPYASQTGVLEFTAPFFNSIELDDISFSPVTITPEPSPVILTAIAGILFALYRRFVKS